jgi:peptidoglycan/xylan/chitin deacetylase (PgdA/CDA1 family)
MNKMSYSRGQQIAWLYNNILKIMKKILLIVCSLLLTMSFCKAQTHSVWKGKQCAVVLTYDDAIPQQLDNALPVLDSLNLKASFYLTAYFAKDRLLQWKNVAAKGYELGNHTLFHPCTGGTGREWVKPDYDLQHYTVQRMVDETRMTNVFLQSLDGQTKRTFAYTCGDMKIGDTSFINLMKNDFVAARAVRNEMHTIDKVDLYNVDCYVVDSNTAVQMMEWVKKAQASNSLLVILFHGVGGGNSLNVSVAEHSKFLHYLKQNEKDLWIATMMDVAEYVKQYQASK